MNHVLLILGLLIVATLSAAKNDNGERRRKVEGSKNLGNPFQLQVNLAESPQCKADVERLCPEENQENNFMILDCLQKDEEVYKQLSSVCHRFIWSYKRNLTLDSRFENAVRSICGAEMLNQTGCASSVGKKGHLITCMIENYRYVTLDGCRFFLTKMASIIFTDYRLIEGFYDSCHEDIVQHDCAKLEPIDLETLLANESDAAKAADSDEVDLPIHQGETIRCLQSKIRDKRRPISSECRLAILRVSELQANDFGLDRQLYYACRLDRESFCASVPAGEGRVYACLMQNQDETGFSKHCRDELHRREALIEEDVRVDKSFYDACEPALKSYKCSRSNQGLEILDVAHALVCLNDAINEGDRHDKVTHTCKRELALLHHRVFADAPMSPKIVAACSVEIASNCNEPQYTENVADLFHCLMEHAVGAMADKKQRERMVQDNSIADLRHPGLSDTCFAELRTLMREADIVEDIRVDPVLYSACESVAKVACADADNEVSTAGTQLKKKHDSASLFVCLVEHMADSVMQPLCAKRLMEIEYFVTRDYHLDAALLRACSYDARVQCHAGDRKWFEQHPNKRQQLDDGEAIEDEADNSLAMSDAEADQTEVKSVDVAPRHGRARRQKRAPRRNVESEVQSDSLDRDVDEEIIELEHEDFVLPCLFGLMKRERLNESCAVEVRRTIRERSMFVGLMPEVERACFYDLTKLCSDGDNVRSPGAEMACLESHFEDLHPRCRVAVANFTRDVRIDASVDFYTFKVCAKPMHTYCQPILNARTAWKHALDVHVLNGEASQQETLMDCLIHHKNEPLVNEDCRLLITHHQRVSEIESIEVSVSLYRACQKDAMELCPDAQKGRKQDVLACMSEVWTIDYLRTNGLFFNESANMQNAQYEFDVANKIADQVEDNEPTQRISSTCRKQLEREFSQQEEDVELDDVVLNNCAEDIAEHCTGLDPKKDSRGQVVECLKEHFEVLKKTCRFVLFKHELRDTADQRIDYGLQQACGTMISTYCADEDKMGIIECLKSKKTESNFDRACYKVVVTREIIQAQDIRLNPQLTKSCRIDVAHHCDSVLRSHATEQQKLAKKLDEEAAHNAMRGRQDVHMLVENRVRQHRALAYEFHGEVIHCLREQYVKTMIAAQVNPAEIDENDALSEQCGDQLRFMMRESALNLHLDPVLKHACTSELQRCQDALENPSFLPAKHVVSSRNDPIRDVLLPVGGVEVRIGVSRVEDCLKEQLAKAPKGFGSECRKEVIRLFQEARADVHVDPVLHKACALDLTYYCQGVPLGMGQQFACLLQALQTKENRPLLRPECAQRLRERMDMFDAAMQRAPANSLGELAEQMVNSPQRLYFGGVIVALLLAIFVIGMTCGCLTRRRAKIIQKSK